MLPSKPFHSLSNLILVNSLRLHLLLSWLYQRHLARMARLSKFLGWGTDTMLQWIFVENVLQLGSLFIWYWILKAYDLKATMQLALFIKSVSLLICYFLPQFPYVLFIADVLQWLTAVLGLLTAFYFPMKWFRSEMRFFFTSLLRLALHLFSLSFSCLFKTQTKI